MTTTNKPYEKQSYFAITLDPVHVGTGGYRLGRVDNTITREPGTNIPKIPGSSIAGATRAYTAMAIQDENYEPPAKNAEGWVIDHEKYKKWKYQRPDYDFIMNDSVIKKATDGKAIIKPTAKDTPMIKKDKDGKDIYYSCAGKGADDGEGHCGQPDCEVCVPFGFSKGKSGSSFQGLAQFFDARILFFPVHSMIGPIWITSPSVLAEFKQILTINPERFKAINKTYDNNLNFGWLMLERDTPSTAELDLSFLSTCEACVTIKDKTFLVPDKLFSRIINDNLEVRTSLAIDPATGAAEDGALYTYEAIPRATVMWFDVVYNKPEYFRIKTKEKVIRDGKEEEKILEKKIMKDNTTEADSKWIKENVEKGLSFMEFMGVGGMNTRGMGRLRVLNLEQNVITQAGTEGGAK